MEIPKDVLSVLSGKIYRFSIKVKISLAEYLKRVGLAITNMILLKNVKQIKKIEGDLLLMKILIYI
jgi:hypothetical protein